ncbi:phosphonate transport system ATP-binding protein [Nonomuraea fuscirosea]|uniref:Phosphonate transport system ATP-binding protein n=1 Tax=Nonomuraea fuscirosea TaxID=1291556 RepID=A0A2T0LK89_9ACTN|nr:phosphonate ABC transporter ATP-binding protein [Nonomuraea fuscirosea]PRX43218.1 phosphonate transport system ATP-binding protein [Nonomuraea fuscirosea]
MTNGEWPVIETRGLIKTFGDVIACDHIDLTVWRGEIVGLLGPSGSGKSTLLRHLNGLTRADGGHVRVLGVDLSVAKGRELRALRRRIGVVFQQFNLVGRLTVMENVLTGALGRVRGPRYGIVTWPRAVRAEAFQHLDRVGLADRAYQRAGSLSGGQQQRVAIARALLQRPDLVLADEPVASLDPQTAASIMDLLVRVCREDQLTMVCTLHQIELAAEWTRRIVGLRLGRIRLDEATERLSAERLRGLYLPDPTSDTVTIA